MMKLVLFLIFSSMSSCSALEYLFSVNNRTDSLTCDKFCQKKVTLYSNGRLHESQFCASSWSCNPMRGEHSYNVVHDSFTLSYVCCNKDPCIIEDQPYINTTKNGLQCYACQNSNSTICNQTVECVGIQDRCMNGTVDDIKRYGCVSRSMCNEDIFESTCCESSFCNSLEPLPESGQMTSAFSVVLIVFSVLIPLDAFII